MLRVCKELQASGIKINTGFIVDAPIIGALSSTKKAELQTDHADAELAPA